MANRPASSAPQKTRSPKSARSSGKHVESAAAPDQEQLPDAATLHALLRPVRIFQSEPRYKRLRDALRRLSLQPPQVLLLEGGTGPERLAAAHYWTLLLNCPACAASSPAPDSGSVAARPCGAAENAADRGHETAREARAADSDAQEENRRPDSDPERSPCLVCSLCLRAACFLHRDLFFLDGRAGSIKIDEVRAVRAVLGEPPREARRRVVLLCEAQSLVEAAANALLKSLEEPQPDTCFILLAPQRERLLPTLVSRSFTLTLPWPQTRAGEPRHMATGHQTPAAAESLAAWEQALCVFMKTGRGWLQRTGAKGAVDADLVHGLCEACRRALAARMLALQTGEAPGSPLEELFAALPARRLRILNEVLAECQDSLIFGVNPSLVAEWLGTRLFLLLPR